MWRFETTSTLSVPEMGPVTVRRFWMVLRVGVTVSTTGTISFPPDRSLMPVIPRMAMAAAIMIFFLFGFLGFFSVVPASRESSSLSNSSGEIFSSLLILMCSFRGFLC